MKLRRRALIAAALEALRASTPAAAKYATTRPSVLMRILRLYLREGFAPRESFIWGLANPRLPALELAAHLSKRRLMELQRRYNSRSRDCLTEDKSIFYPLCRGYGLAIPELYAVFAPPVAGWTASGQMPRGRSEWSAFFRAALPAEFVVKPAWGVYGWGLRVFERKGDEFLTRSGERYDPEALYDLLASDTVYRSFVVQEVLTPHPALVKLSGTGALQTARMVTLAAPDGPPELVFSTMKIIHGDGLSDNFSFGRSGNLLADIRGESGTLCQAVGSAPDGIGLVPLARHPRTGVAFDGFELPFWTEACALVRDAAQRFRPTATIGWDVALTPAGPRLVEGNMWWDPLQNAHRRMGEFLEACRRRA